MLDQNVLKGSTIGSMTSEEPSSSNFSNASLVKDNGAPPMIASPDVGDVTGVRSLPSPLSAMAPGTPSTSDPTMKIEIFMAKKNICL
ncbi:hypothetical protein CHS0354_041525 [Potamilus streckersoni]|uniref:Uncharacterized protein n=1 Tax=Potamilus streckersoni TaxID=2493646 RepID=A0AAE0TB83_9BIVA|nr:hypothetical protein CHS0354_041525 [Potamilus streckersoni]